MARNVTYQHREGPLSLKRVYEPDSALPYLDIVLIHGPGRTSAETWTKEGQPPYFWPDWLRDKGSLRMARVWTARYRTADLRQDLLRRPQDTINGFVEYMWKILVNDVS